MPNSKEIVEHVIRDQFGLEEVDINADIRTDYDADDLDMIEIIMAIEEKLPSVEIPDIDYSTGQDLLTVIDVFI